MGRRLGWLRGMMVALVVLGALAPIGAFAAKRGSPPAITGVVPPSGPLGGGTAVTITGVAFEKTTEVDFGGVSAGFSQTKDTIITAVSPPGSAGTVDITVTTQDGTSSITTADEFTYQGVPVVKKLDPISGPIAGGTVVTITGSNFIGATKVEFGFAVSEVFRVKSATSIQAVSPAGTGAQDVTVTTPSGSNDKGPQFTFEDAPVVDFLDPPSGPPAGGTKVVIHGENFVGALEVVWAKTVFQPKAFVVNDRGTTITLTSPKGSVGRVDVKVVTTSGTSTASPFTYQDAPKVTSVAPRSGSTKGGTKVLVKGQNFVGATGVTFGGKAGTSLDVTSGSELTVVAPAGSGTVDVQVTTSSGTSAKVTADHFTYQGVPVVKSVSPSSGVLAGGTKVTIKGTGFLDAVAVKFGNTAATGVKVVSSTEITAISPAGTGTVHVTVTTAVGTSAKGTADEFTYSSHATPSGGVQTGGGGAAGGGFPWIPFTVILLSLAGFAALRFWYRRA
jgi:hypothetical protein